MTVTKWLESDRLPADIYDLLDRPRFDPDRQELLTAVRAQYAALLPCQNHRDSRIARRAVELQHQLGWAESVLSSPKRLQEHHREILETLRAAMVEAQKRAGPFSANQALDWLRGQSIHPQRLAAVARQLIAPSSETGPSEAAEAGEFDLCVAEPAVITAELCEEAPRPAISDAAAYRLRKRDAEKRIRRVAWIVLIAVASTIGLLVFVILLAMPSGGPRRGRTRPEIPTASFRRPTELANLIRSPPKPGVAAAFQARYGGYRNEAITIYPSLSDRRAVAVEFPGVSASDFACYQANDAVFVVAELSPRAGPSRLVLRGKNIRRMEEPTSPVSAR